MALYFGHFIVAVLFTTNIHLGMGKPGFGIDYKRRERVGNRRRSNFRGLFRLLHIPNRGTCTLPSERAITRSAPWRPVHRANILGDCNAGTGRSHNPESAESRPRTPGSA